MNSVDPDYEVYAYEAYPGRGSSRAASDGDVRYPIQYFAAELEGLEPQGLDLGSDARLRRQIERALEQDQPTASDPGWFVGTDQEDIVLVMWPVIRDDGVQQGVSVVVVDMSELVAAAVPGDLGDGISWTVAGLEGADTSAIGGSGGRWATTIPVLDTAWVIEVTSNTAPWNLLTLVAILGTGLGISLGGGYGTHLIVQRVRSRRELDRLRSLNAQKDQFLAAVSHALRTPLTSILGFAQELTGRPGDFDAAERAELLTYISDEARSMEGVVQDLLVAAHQEEGGTVTIRREHLRDVAGRVRRVVGQHLTGRYAAVSIDGNAAVWADGDRMAQVLRNLIDNALQHGEPPIKVSICVDDPYARIIVRDHGQGVPEAAVDELFNRYDAGPGKEGMPDSTGLGLSVARQLARLMGGDLRYLGGDGGASFELLLLAADGAEATATEDETADVTSAPTTS